MKIGRWEIPDELFERYLRVVNATEKSSERYNYEFDQLRETIHQEILDYVGVMVNMSDYMEFQRALQDLCEEMLPERVIFQDKKIKPCKLTTPVRGLIGKKNDSN